MMRTSLAAVVLFSALAAEAQTLRVAAPGFRPAGVEAAIAEEISERFALELEAEGLEVTTPREIREALGEERGRQLVGCEQESSSCLADLTTALNVQAVVTGTVARIGSRLYANVKLLSQGGQIYGVFARSGRTVGDLHAALADAAAQAATDVFRGHGRDLPLTARSRQPYLQRPNAVTYFLGGLILDAIGVEYERVFTSHLTGTALGVFVYSNFVHEGVLNYQIGAELLLGARLYPGGQAMNGFWVAAELQLGGGHWEEGSLENHTGLLLAPGLATGVAFTTRSGFTASLGIGVYRHLLPFTFSDSYKKWLQWVPRANLGWAF